MLLAQPSDRNKRDRCEAVFLFPADGFPKFRYWHKADIGLCAAHVRYVG
jgi:hypothetical protein